MWSWVRYILIPGQCDMSENSEISFRIHVADVHARHGRAGGKTILSVCRRNWNNRTLESSVEAQHTYSLMSSRARSLHTFTASVVWIPHVVSDINFFFWWRDDSCKNVVLENKCVHITIKHKSLIFLNVFTKQDNTIWKKTLNLTNWLVISFTDIY